MRRRSSAALATSVSVVRAAQHLARRRLLHPARGILLRVDQCALVIALDQQRHLAQKYACHRVFDTFLGVYLVECDVSVDELLHRLRVANVSERQPEAQHPLNNRVVAVTVHHPQPRLPPTYNSREIISKHRPTPSRSSNARVFSS